VLWSASIGDAGRFVFSPVLAGDSVYAASRDGSVARLDAATGRTLWRVTLDARLSGESQRRNACRGGHRRRRGLCARRSERQRPLARAVSSEVLAAPVVGAGLVLVRSGDSRIFAFEQSDGKRRWVYQRAACFASSSARLPGVTIAGDSAYAGFPPARLVAISLENGGVRWEASVALPRGATELERHHRSAGQSTAEGARGLRRRIPGPRRLLRRAQRQSALVARGILAHRRESRRKQCLRSDDKGAGTGA